MIIVNNFILYGLNRYRNFLIEGGSVYLENELEVVDFCCNKMAESECYSPGMFAVFLDGTYMALTLLFDKRESDIKVAIGKKRDMHFFSEFDALYRLCCYGLICEIRPGEWEIMK